MNVTEGLWVDVSSKWTQARLFLGFSPLVIVVPVLFCLAFVAIQEKKAQAKKKLDDLTAEAVALKDAPSADLIKVETSLSDLEKIKSFIEDDPQLLNKHTETTLILTKVAERARIEQKRKDHKLVLIRSVTIGLSFLYHIS